MEKGTPQRGSDLARFGKSLAYIAATFSNLNPAQRLLRDLQKDSEALREIASDFTHRCNTIHIVSFFETKRTAFGPFFSRMVSYAIFPPRGLFSDLKQVVERESAILGWPEEHPIPQNTDHRGIAKFHSRDDRNFRPLILRLEHLQNILKQYGFLGGDAVNSALSARAGVEPGRRRIPLALTVPPCPILLGRDDVLSILYNYFHAEQLGGTPIRRTFAICGLGKPFTM